MSTYDYIIVGAGASGLLLADALGSDSFFSKKSILLLDKSDKSQNDRTWCFWEKDTGPFFQMGHVDMKVVGSPVRFRDMCPMNGDVIPVARIHQNFGSPCIQRANRTSRSLERFIDSTVVTEPTGMKWIHAQAKATILDVNTMLSIIHFLPKRKVGIVA